MGKIDKKIVAHIAKLANIPVTEKEQENLAAGFNTTLDVVDALFKVDVSNVLAVHRVTKLENVFREDKVDEKKMFSQEQALSNTKNKHNGYFVVDQILAQD